ncbi:MULTISPECIES: hypothetical protein [Photorhabdus]|uniref:hypothetical protein n=1 Tax=Photorhabdus TaxID=29487 RepID=UPI000DCBEC43|nr:MULTISPECIES: hypothetical protein [Photorhabdus]MCT8344721.1 hypothetical protein [Photorhabdus kleinii]RAW96472.1 hypothetical protein CKY03_15285 [Photorhabdus sp. S9-53]RAW97561.1 hypothetical protein CKY05_13155 [Photorhabdus sp. S10-54]RAX00648.1 hypothetical protein CKY04_15590 [Photorhabdus sp. S8-52]
MDGAKEIAGKMVATIDDDSSWLTGFAEGVLDIPVDFYYVGYDYLDTEYRWDNENDKYRFVGLIKSEAITLNNLERIIQIIFEDYLGKLSEEQKQRLIETKVGKIFGGMISKYVIFRGSLGAFFGAKWFTKLGGSVTFTATLGVGASVSRAIYTSRELAQTNPNLYMLLRREGNLDLLYFLVESKMEPYVRALEAYDENRGLFNEIFDEFSVGLDK